MIKISLSVILILLSVMASHAQESSKVIKEFHIKFKSTNSDDRVKAVQTLQALPWKVTINILLTAFEDNSLKVLKATQEVVESYHESLDLAKLLISKGIGEVKNDFGRSYLINALGKFRYPEVSAGLFKLLKLTPNPNIAVPIIESIGILGFEESIPELIKLRKNSLYTRHFGFRSSLFEALIQFPDKQVVEFFISTLEENEGIIATQTQEYLVLVAGTRQTTAANWKKWWEENKATVEIKKATLEEINNKIRSIIPEGETPYYGMSILAKRITFIVDTSGSMKIANDKESRLDVAKNELSNVIKGLSEKCLVEIITFSSNSSAWFNELKSPTKTFKIEVEKRIKQKQPAGGTNTYAAFEDSFKTSENTEAIYFLSDGAPSLGLIIENEPLLEQIYRWNRFRKIQINCIGLIFGVVPPEFTQKGFKEDTEKLKQFLKLVATQNNGQYKFIE